jgi:hypothetical protein
MLSTDRQGVVILGMHRSGTSAVAGATVRLGLAPPLTPLPAADDNPGGFYESLLVVHINHHLLRGAGCAWNLSLTFDPDCIEPMLQPSDRETIAQTLEREFGASPAFVLKDPRLCLTLPAWLPPLRAAGIVPSVLIVVRHPAEVVQSLLRRNQFPEAETAPQWLQHMLEAEWLSRGLDRAIVFYDDLLRDWRGCLGRAGACAGVAWPRPIDEAAGEIDAFLSGSARHHAVAATSAFVGPPGVDEMVNAVWSTLRYLSEDPDSSVALACLDHVRGQFAAWRRDVIPPGFRVVFADA